MRAPGRARAERERGAFALKSDPFRPPSSHIHIHNHVNSPHAALSYPMLPGEKVDSLQPANRPFHTLPNVVMSPHCGQCLCPPTHLPTLPPFHTASEPSSQPPGVLERHEHLTFTFTALPPPPSPMQYEGQSSTSKAKDRVRELVGMLTSYATTGKLPNRFDLDAGY